jgi:formylglycine-generating enzyme required for sulfatase activity
MVYVPAGEFKMGSSREGYDDEHPQHSVTLDGFWIDRYEVTNSQFAAFLNENGNQTEGGVTWLMEVSDALIERVGDRFLPKDGYANHPVVRISWYGAKSYGEWVGGRLPTEAEWEKAARGTSAQMYPWGDDPPTHTLCNFSQDGIRTMPIGSYSPKGDSPYGCADMAGNVWEWTQSLHRPYPYDSGDGRENTEIYGRRVIRSGSFNSFSRDVHSARRAPNISLFDEPTDRDWDLGFRIVVEQ